MQDQVFVETVSAINVNNGVVKLIMVKQDLREPSEEVQTIHAQTVVMPIAGFMYTVGVIQNLLDDPKMKERLEGLKKAGFLPASEEEDV